MLIKLTPEVISSVISSAAIVYIYPDKVLKVVSRRRTDLKEKNYKDEAYFLTKYKSPYFVKLLDAPKKQLPTFILENVGIMTGSSRLLKKQHRNEKLRKWLRGLDEELQNMKIAHGDIAPCNILFNGEKYTLIDFEFAVEEGDENYNKRFMRDRECIKRLIAQTKGDVNAHT